jgi:hypothetical protein
MNISIVTALLLCFAAAGCAYRQFDGIPAITSFKDPAYAGAEFKRIAIIADLSDLEWRKRLESRMTESFKEWGIMAVESNMLIPPTRQWSPEERLNVLAKNGVDGYLSVTVDTTDVTETYIPATYTTTTTREKPDKGKSEETAVTKQQGGYTVTKASTRYRLTLVDRATGRTAWIALNDLGSSPSSRLRPFCEEIAAQLERDGLVHPSGPIDTD